MKLRIPDKYYLTAIILLTFSSVFIALPLIIHIGDATTATFIFAGMVFVMTGSFVFMLSRGEPMDPRIVGLLPAQGSLTLCRISSDMDICGNAHFLPPRITNTARVMQLNPAAEYNGSKIQSEKSVLETGFRGFLTIPSCDLLIQDLKERNEMVIPILPEELTVLLNEIIIDTFEFASRVSATWNDELITITLHDYQFIEGCRTLVKNNPQCCSRFPCPVCSLCGVIIAEGTDGIITLEHCIPDPSSRDVTITLVEKLTEEILRKKILPDGNAEIQVPVTRIDPVAVSGEDRAGEGIIE
jgi:hypothetical protein